MLGEEMAGKDGLDVLAGRKESCRTHMDGTNAGAGIDALHAIPLIRAQELETENFFAFLKEKSPCLHSRSGRTNQCAEWS